MRTPISTRRNDIEGVRGTFPSPLWTAVPVLLLLVLEVRPVLAQTFYPPAPSPPRYQLLTRIQSEKDLRKEPNWFMRFLFGKQMEDQWLRNAFRHPFQVAFEEDSLVVTDTRTSSYWILDLEERTMGQAPEPRGSTRIRSGAGIAADDRGRLLLADGSAGRILLIEPPDRVRAVIGEDLLERPAGLAVRGDSVYAADPGTNRIAAFHIDSGAGRIVVGGNTPDDSPLGGPSAVAFAPDGTFYVAESLAGRVSRYALDGSLVEVVGERGIRYGQFGVPKSLAVDPEGRLYVTDARYEHVVVFDPHGRVLLTFGRIDDPETDLAVPAGIAISTGSMDLWQEFAEEGFQLDYIVAVVRQFQPAGVYIYGFGRMQGIDYPEPPPPD